MSSHGGQQNFPFGYQPQNIHGIGLPDFMNPGPPPGQPLLNDHENADLNNFFSDFDTNATPSKQSGQPQYHTGATQDQLWNMPPTFVGSETLGPRTGIDPNHLQMGGYMFGDGLVGQDMNVMAGQHMFDSNLQNTAFPDQNFSAPLLHQLQTAASSIQPGYGPGWQQSYQPQQLMPINSAGRVAMRFGSDSHFQPTGYVPPSGPMDPDMVHPLDWLEATTATNTQTNTQPNTQPNTEPSSPIWTKKRKWDDFQQQEQPRRNGFVTESEASKISAQPSPPNSNPRRQKKSMNRLDHHHHHQVAASTSSQPPTPLTASKPHTPLDPEEDEDQDEDAEAEDDDDNDADDGLGDSDIENQSSRDPSWPALLTKPSLSRPRANPKTTTPSKPPRKRSSTSAAKPATTSSTVLSRPKHQPRISSSSSASRLNNSNNNNTSRKPLTQQQKKANHTSSEQRRRDATARAFAELYDLVPELDGMGKQSTMKRLEVVVEKVAKVKARVEALRATLGVDSTVSMAASASASASSSLGVITRPNTADSRVATSGLVHDGGLGGWQ